MSEGIHFTKFSGLDRPQGKSSMVQWGDVVERFKEPRVYKEKKAMPLFSFTEFEGDYRKKENAGMVHAIVVEHDAETMTPQDAADVMKEHAIACVIYTTPSHSWEAPRWRLVAKLSHPVDEVEHGRMVRILNELLDGAIAGESIHTEREWYYGRVDGVEYECLAVNGEALDDQLDFGLLARERELVQTGGGGQKRRSTDMLDALTWDLPNPEPPTQEAADRIRSALEASRVDPDAPYEGGTGRGPMTWRDVIMALHSTQHPQAKQIAEEWSRRATKYKFNQAEFDKLWASLTIDRESTKTLGSLIHHAKEHAWVDPWSMNKDIMESYGDIANGQRFAAKHRGEFMYVFGWKEWVYWDGLRWKRCLSGEQMSAAKKVAVDSLHEAAEKKAERGSEVDKANYTMANKVASDIGRVGNILKSAYSEPGMGVGDQSLFDGEPYLLGVKNGVVNLHTGELLKAHQAMLITKQANCAYEPGAKCERFLEFMDDIFMGDAEIVRFIKQASGLALIGKMLNETLFFMMGSGSNGKSVFANILHSIFGDYVVTMNASVLMRDKYGSSAEATREKARLHGMRLVLMNELESDDVFSEKTLKDMVSTEVITARNLYEKSFQFTPMHTIFLRGNHLPGVKDTTDGFWRRMALIEFKRQYADHEKIPDLANIILKNERNGIFMWMLEGALEVQKKGLDKPEAVTKLSSQYRKDSDVIGEWIDSCLVKSPSATVQLGILYRSYVDHMEYVGMRHPMPQLKLKKTLIERGFTFIKRDTGQVAFGLDLADDGVWSKLSENPDDEL